MNAMTEWAAMNGEVQFNALIAMTWTAKRRDDAAECGQKMQWIKTQDDAQTNAAEAWLEMEKEAAKATEQGQPLAIALFRAVMTAAQRIDRQERRATRALFIEDLTDEQNAARRDCIETADRPTEDTCMATVAHDELAKACRDQRDLVIVSALIVGLTVAESAVIAEISQPAASKRIQKIRQRCASAA